jgi:hypothetical protein
MIDKTPAQKIISALEDRGGFDSWWGCLPKNIQEEVIEEMAEIIDEHIEFNWR